MSLDTVTREVPAAPVGAQSRRASMVALFLGVAAMGTGMVGAGTASTLIAADVVGDGWSGVPNAAAVFGTAAGALGGGLLVHLRGVRHALMLMYALAAAGAGIAVLGAVGEQLLLMLLGMALLGIGSGAAQMSRYAAAELYPAARKGFGLSVIVWAGTVGALAGPALLAPAAKAAEGLELTGLAGPILAAGVLAAAAALSVSRLPKRVPVHVERPRGGVAAALRSRQVLGPLSAMVGAQVAMVAVMTMTPVQIAHAGLGLSELGWVLAAHMVGMFALAPVSGQIVDRWGGQVAIYAGIGVLALSVGTVVAAPTSHDAGLPAGLFLLGYGWNLVFVGGSNLLSTQLEPAVRARVQGAVDACVWGASALASLGAGPLYETGGLVLVAVVAGVIAAVPLVLLPRDARSTQRR